MKRYLAFILNLPWTIIGLVLAIISLPKSMQFSSQELGIIVYVRSFWWYTWLPSKKGIRAITNGHVISLGPTADIKDCQHELIHVEQSIREPLIHPFLYSWQSFRHGYRNNKYEVEAYTKSGSRFAE